VMSWGVAVVMASLLRCENLIRVYQSYILRNKSPRVEPTGRVRGEGIRGKSAKSPQEYPNASTLPNAGGRCHRRSGPGSHRYRALPSATTTLSANIDAIRRTSSSGAVDSCAVMSNPFRIGNQLVERAFLPRAYTDRCSSGCHRGQRSVFDVVMKYIDGICGPGLTLGYAGTLHSAQGMTIGSSRQYGVCLSIFSDRASRSIAYVGMTRGRDQNHLAIYAAVANEAHQHHHAADTGVHQMHRGTKHIAAHYFRMILANDDRASTMHTVAARTDRELLTAVVAALLERNDQRRADRARAWRQHTDLARAREAAFERLSATSTQAVGRQLSRSQNRGYGLEL
jgi:hypothetical protein